MLPSISTVIDIELIRDGGSLAATFIGANAATYRLHFKLISSCSDDGQYTRHGYERPVIFESFRFHFGEDRVAWEALSTVEISWQHALVFLHQLRGHVRDDSNFKWLEAMEEVAETEGRLPGYFQ